MTMDATRTPDPLWLPVVAPMVWALHFMVCYFWAALACGRFGVIAPFDSLPIAVALLTAAALAVITGLLMHGFRRHGYAWPDRSNDDGTPEDRTKFMAFTTMLLAGLSWVATLYVGVAVWSIGGCQ